MSRSSFYHSVPVQRPLLFKMHQNEHPFTESAITEIQDNRKLRPCPNEQKKTKNLIVRLPLFE